MTYRQLKIFHFLLKKSRVTLIAFPLQQWLHERGSMLRYTYIAYLVFLLFNTIHQNNNLKHATFYFHIVYNVWKPLYLLKLL